MIQLKLNPEERIAFISDVHVDSRMPESRIDDIIVTLRDKMMDILKKCKDRNVKYVFFEGDIVNRIQCPFEPITMIAEVLLEFKKSDMRCFTVLGNHDIVRNSLESIDKSPIQILFTLGAIEHINLKTLVEINGTTLITPVDYTELPISAKSEYAQNILLAHAFYNAPDFIADSRHNITEKDVENLGYDLIVLGHDHGDYEDEIVGKCRIVRHGSVLRGMSHNYNFTRKPNFVIVNNINDVANSVERIEIQHRDYKDVASEYMLNRKTFNSLTGLQDVLSNLADKLTDTTETDSDRIYNIIINDENLPTNCRNILLKYINENI